MHFEGVRALAMTDGVDAQLDLAEGSDLEKLAADARESGKAAARRDPAQRHGGHVAAERSPHLPVRRKRGAIAARFPNHLGIRQEISHVVYVDRKAK